MGIMAMYEACLSVDNTTDKQLLDAMDVGGTVYKHGNLIKEGDVVKIIGLRVRELASMTRGNLDAALRNLVPIFLCISSKLFCFRPSDAPS